MGPGSDGLEEFARHHDVELQSKKESSSTDKVIIFLEGKKENVDMAAREINFVSETFVCLSVFQLTQCIQLA